MQLVHAPLSRLLSTRMQTTCNRYVLGLCLVMSAHQISTCQPILEHLHDATMNNHHNAKCNKHDSQLALQWSSCAPYPAELPDIHIYLHIYICIQARCRLNSLHVCVYFAKFSCPKTRTCEDSWDIRVYTCKYPNLGSPNYTTCEGVP